MDSIAKIALEISTFTIQYVIFTVTCAAGSGGKNKRYYATEADDLGAPLSAGWRRETTIREYTKSGIRGEVVYVAPCGKRFKQYPDIIRVSGFYLADTLKNGFIKYFAPQLILFCSISRKGE